jgi:beta-N-acetylhexosaminidase
MCGQLVIGGFVGAGLPDTFARSLAAGERGGAILFSRNLTGDPMQAASLTEAIARAAPPDVPPLVAIDQEGGRVARLKAPLLVLPPMREFAVRGDEAFAHEAARAQAEELAALGFTTSFSPVLDVNTCDANPVIGDRAFGDDADAVSRFGVAWARGLEAGGILPCGKHFPGHGDTSQDSHVDLPSVTVNRSRLDAVELAPFRAAAASGIAALMTAHVVYPALDPRVPATLSRAVCTELLRGDMGFRGWLVSDDLEMKAIADRVTVEDAAIQAIDAGCDALLICRSEELQARATDALAKRASDDARFEARCRDALARGLAARRRFPSRSVHTRAAFDASGERARSVAARLATWSRRP